jgi:hypothetical protein
MDDLPGLPSVSIKAYMSRRSGRRLRNCFNPPVGRATTRDDMLRKASPRLTGSRFFEQRSADFETRPADYRVFTIASAFSTCSEGEI